MSVLDRFGKVVKAEWSHRFGREREGHERPRAPGERGERAPVPPAPRRPAVADVEGALRVLELVGTPQGPPGLDEVRARYRELARRYHPKTASDNADEAHAARVVVEALTDALELLEEQLLPLPASGAPRG